MVKKFGWIVAALVIASAAGARSARGDVPPTITQQGRLLSVDGQSVNGPVTFVFSIYDVATVGTPLWQEAQTITLDDGYFSARLGETVSLNQVAGAPLFNGSVRYLGIKVSTDPEEMSPRQPIGSVPYALVADDATGVIHPKSVVVGGKEVIDSTGAWKGATTGLVGPAGPAGARGPAGPVGVPCTGCVNSPSLASAAVTGTKMGQAISTILRRNINPGETLTDVFVQCPANRYMLAGGCRSFPGVQIFRNLPYRDPSSNVLSWVCGFQNTTAAVHETSTVAWCLQ